MSLDGATIPIVEFEMRTFAVSLPEALEAGEAQSVVARDGSEAQQRLHKLQVSAALLNEEQREIEGELSERGPISCPRMSHLGPGVWFLRSARIKGS